MVKSSFGRYSLLEYLKYILKCLMNSMQLDYFCHWLRIQGFEVFCSCKVYRLDLIIYFLLTSCLLLLILHSLLWNFSIIKKFLRHAKPTPSLFQDDG